MSGYREHSYDPNQYEQLGHPLRPFNWVQWIGMALGSVGIGLTLLDFAGRLEWIPQWVDDPSPASFLLVIVGLALINSRRAEATDPAPELAAQRRRWLLITLAVCAVILGAAALIEFLGA